MAFLYAFYSYDYTLTLSVSLSYIYIYKVTVLQSANRRLRGRRAYLGARMKNDVSRRAVEERRISSRG